MTSNPSMPAMPTSPLRGEVDAQRRVRGAKVTKSQTGKARTLRSTETDAEHRFWNMVRNRGLGGHKFVRQYAIGPYFADFVCRDAMLVVEIDGGQHNGSVRDGLRTKALNALGYSVLRFWNNEILENLEGVADVLLATLGGNPSPGWRYTPATLSPEGRGYSGTT